MKQVVTVDIHRESPIQCHPAYGLIERTSDAAADDAGNAAPY
jgi:hypothetical protein